MTIVLSIHISSLKLTIRSPDPNKKRGDSKLVVSKAELLEAEQKQKIKLKQELLEQELEELKLKSIFDEYNFLGP